MDSGQTNRAIMDLVDICGELFALYEQQQLRIEQQRCRIELLEEKQEGLAASLGLDHVVVAQQIPGGSLWGWTAIPAAAWAEVQAANPGMVSTFPCTLANALALIAEKHAPRPDTRRT